MRSCMLTTMDNKFNPFTEFDDWLDFDEREKGYNTSALIAFFSRNSTEFDEQEYLDEAERAMDKVLAINPYGLHVKVYEDDADTFIPLMNKVFEENKPEGYE